MYRIMRRAQKRWPVQRRGRSVTRKAKLSEEMRWSAREGKEREKVGQHRGDTWRARASPTHSPVDRERPTCLNVDDFPPHGCCVVRYLIGEQVAKRVCGDFPTAGTSGGRMSDSRKHSPP